MRFRKLRIAWSVVWGLAALLMVVLWVDSYRNFGGAWWQAETIGLGVHYGFGHLVFAQEKPHKQRFAYPNWYWGAGRTPATDLINWEKDMLNYHKAVEFGWSEDWKQRFIMIPHWFAAILLGAGGGLPWLSFRFTLRTLLIATTLVAVVLGLIVWLSR
jgi:hypothetical protein